MMKRTFLSLVSMAFICAMTLTSCDEIMSTIDNPVGSYVQFNDSVLNLTPGQVAQNVATTISTEKVTYTSSDKSIATVDPNGFVTAIAFGEATITASVKATEYYAAGSATYKVKVGSEAEKAMKEGAIVAFDLNVDGVDEKVEFKKVGEEFVYQAPAMSAPRRAAAITTSYSLVYLKAMNAMVFRVIQTNGTETAYPLTVIINLTANTIQVIPGSPLSKVLFVNISLNGVTITGKLTKKEVAPTGITLPATAKVAKGLSIQLEATVLPEDATDKKVTWESVNPTIATVDQQGNVTGVAEGEATIKAKIGNYTASCVVTVTKVTIDLSKLTADYTANDSEVLTGATNYQVSIAAGATVYLNGVTITNSNFGTSALKCLGNATIVLVDGSTNKIENSVGLDAQQGGGPGIQVGAAGTTLTIKGGSLATGQLTAIGGKQSAGIGTGGWKGTCGNIVIQSGTIVAEGKSSAGIGCSYSASCGNITISGGTVTATGGQYAAGIGTSVTYFDNCTTSMCGDITISGGTVTATGGEFAAAIGTGVAGSGDHVSKCGNITITNGVTKVMATRGTNAPKTIGKGGVSGFYGTCGTVTVGGTEYADGIWENGTYTYQP
jgi:uncharacterized protein YjdB